MKKARIILCILISILGLASCAKKEKDPEKMYSVFYLSNSETKLEMHECEMTGISTEDQVKELLLYLQTNPTSLKYRAPLAMGFEILGYEIDSGKVMVNVSEKYKELSVTQEILIRAATVKTLTQLTRINFVAFEVEGEPLADALGKTVGWMNKDQFLENEGSEINTYEEIELKLYFANEKGDGLLETTRTKEYNGNVPMEKLIVEELIKGPNGEGIYPTINTQTKVASVIIQDGVCYVNLDETFLAPVPNVTPEVTIYSIANSLIVQLRGVKKVQILVNGDSQIIYRDKLNLEAYYEKNPDLVLNSDGQK